MKAAVIVFPGSNCDRDMAVALHHALGSKPIMHWHRDADLPKVDLIAVPGGFSYGDYLRSGAMAAHSPVMKEVVKRAGQGVAVLGVCNGFQILSEAGLTPGVLMRNAHLHFVCRDVRLTVESNDSIFTRAYTKGQTIRIPIAHHDGNYFADAETLKRVEGDGLVAFRYAEGDNPNGSLHNIAGVFNAKRNVLGMMPHPERLADPQLGGTDGKPLFDGLVAALRS
ncbi:MAG: phosphoribosylformylglycinamidine synthase I [Alphaproteobacteria bacterium RIFOXYD12_FULL_60_8]|nr:MAG: phosphoribosylformylglycinamidine synthase I [Alphaproteobacteria bacterium RIFOXYD12_FULL_60_8]